MFSSDPELTDLVEIDIELTDVTPVKAKPYKMSPSRQIFRGRKLGGCWIKEPSK